MGSRHASEQPASGIDEIGRRGRPAPPPRPLPLPLIARSSALAGRHFVASARAYTDVASVRGVGLVLTGLAAAEAAADRPANAVQIAAAAEVFAQQEGIVNVYGDDAPGRTLVEEARASLSPDDAVRATDLGRRLTIQEALDLGGQT
jgi:hypothetical protein